MIFAEHMSRMWWAYVVIFIMLCLSAYFSASEIAFNTANKMRLRHAAEMLATPNITVSEVCYATGFSNPSYFSKVFREAFGCNPGAMDAAHQQPAQEGDGH